VESGLNDRFTKEAIPRVFKFCQYAKSEISAPSGKVMKVIFIISSFFVTSNLRRRFYQHEACHVLLLFSAYFRFSYSTLALLIFSSVTLLLDSHITLLLSIQHDPCEEYIDGLTAQPWWDAAAFDWVAGLEVRSYISYSFFILLLIYHLLSHYHRHHHHFLYFV
jgi:hypothetical protein